MHPVVDLGRDRRQWLWWQTECCVPNLMPLSRQSFSSLYALMHILEWVAHMSVACQMLGLFVMTVMLLV